MTSKRNQCFVYLWLPGETAAVTAGKYELTLDRRGTPLGRFVYGKTYLERPNAVPIDPVELVLGSRVYETTVLNGVFGALRPGPLRIPLIASAALTLLLWFVGPLLQAAMLPST